MNTSKIRESENLSGHDFTDQTFVGVSFCGSNLAKSTFAGCMISDGEFEDANCAETDFTGANFAGVTIDYEDGGPVEVLEATRFEGAINLDQAIGVPAAILEAWEAAK